MKKAVIVLICILAAGCFETEKQEPVQEINYNLNYNGKYYHIYTPYKHGVGGNYFLTDAFNSYDVNEIERGLLDLSGEYFSVDSYYYQEGQYLTQKELTALLKEGSLNNAAEITVDGKKIKPTYIASIYEENFLDEAGKLKAISLGIVVNRYQVYKDSSGRSTYHTVNEDVAINHAKKQAVILLEHLRAKAALKDVGILVAIYIESSPNSTVPGSYKQYGVTTTNEISWNVINQNKHYLNSTQARSLDVESYNNYQLIDSKIKGALSNIYVSGMGYYQSNKLALAEIKITRSSYRYGELLYLTNVVSENVIKYFENVEVTIEFRENNSVVAYILKNKGSQSTDIFIY